MNKTQFLLDGPSSPANQQYELTVKGSRKVFRCLALNCGKTFAFRSEMTRHLTVHSNIRPFSCSICQKAFKRLDALGNHSKLHFQASSNPKTSSPSPLQDKESTQKKALSSYSECSTLQEEQFSTCDEGKGYDEDSQRENIQYSNQDFTEKGNSSPLEGLKDWDFIALESFCPWDSTFQGNQELGFGGSVEKTSIDSTVVYRPMDIYDYSKGEKDQLFQFLDNNSPLKRRWDDVFDVDRFFVFE